MWASRGRGRGRRTGRGLGRGGKRGEGGAPPGPSASTLYNLSMHLKQMASGMPYAWHGRSRFVVKPEEGQHHIFY